MGYLPYPSQGTFLFGAYKKVLTLTYHVDKITEKQYLCNIFNINVNFL